MIRNTETEVGMFLDTEELRHLTGYKRRAEQLRWLRANGVKFVLNRWGHPRVLRSEVERALTSSADADGQQAPNFAAIRRKAG